MAQPAQILALELIGQAINVDQIAQAHPLIFRRVGASMLKGMGAAERCHRLTIQIDLLAAVPSQSKAGQWCTHMGERPVQIDPLSGWLLADQGKFITTPTAAAPPDTVELAGEQARWAREARGLQQRHSVRQPVGFHQQIQITAAAGGEGASGLQGQRDALDHQQGDGSLLKQGRHLTGEAGEGQGGHGFLTRQGLDRGRQLGQQRGHQRIAMQQSRQAMAPDGGQQSLSWTAIQLVLQRGWHLIAANRSVPMAFPFPLQHQPNQALGGLKGCGCQCGVHPDSGEELWGEN